MDNNKYRILRIYLEINFIENAMRLFAIMKYGLGKSGYAKGYAWGCIKPIAPANKLMRR